MSEERWDVIVIAIPATSEALDALLAATDKLSWATVATDVPDESRANEIVEGLASYNIDLDALGI